MVVSQTMNHKKVSAGWFLYSASF